MDTMIRKFETSDMDQVLDIWLTASIKAHNFVEQSFWESEVDDMRDQYLPSGETYVYDDMGIVKGFVSLRGETLEAVFVSPNAQGKGIGQQLIAKAKELRAKLNLAVYKENQNSLEFYKKCGFKIVGEQLNEHTGHPELLMALNS